LSITDSEIEEQVCHINRKKNAKPDYTNCYLVVYIKPQWKGESQFSTHNECNSGRPCRTRL